MDSPADTLLEHQRFVRSLARKLLADEHEAEDVAQQTLLSALKHPPRSESGARAWLAKATRHVALNLRRGKARRRGRERAPRRCSEVYS